MVKEIMRHDAEYEKRLIILYTRDRDKQCAWMPCLPNPHRHYPAAAVDSRRAERPGARHPITRERSMVHVEVLMKTPSSCSLACLTWHAPPPHRYIVPNSQRKHTLYAHLISLVPHHERGSPR